MGWIGTDRNIWGDKPQDIVDERIEKTLGKRTYNAWIDGDKNIPRRDRIKIYESLLSNQLLKEGLDSIWKEEWNRPMNSYEFKGLLRFGLRLGGSVSSRELKGSYRKVK